MQLTLNNWATNLVAPAPAASLEMTVAAQEAERLGTIDPGDYYAATLARVAGGVEVAWEIVHVTAASAGVLTVERAKEGTTALDWLEGESISVRITADLIRQLHAQLASLADRVTALEGGGSSEQLAVTVALYNGDTAGYGSSGSVTPGSITVPSAGAYQISWLQCRGTNESSVFSMMFLGEFPPASIVSVDVQGVGLLLVSSADEAAIVDQLGTMFTRFEWYAQATDWHTASGQQRTVTINYAT